MLKTNYLRSRHSFYLKSLSLLLAFSFLLTDLSYSAPLDGGGLLNDQKPLELISQDPTRLEAPLDFSSLKEVHSATKMADPSFGGKGSTRPFIIHIQDPHSNLSGQENLAKTLDSLMTKYSISLVLVEGGSHEGTLTPIRNIIPKETCKTLAKSLLLEGQIQGEEYLNLTSNHPMKIQGIEDINLYAKSIVSYSKLANKREAILEYLKTIQSSLNKLKQKLYPKELLLYEKQTKDNLNALLKLTNSKNIDLNNFPNLQQLKSLEQKERQIDFTAANLEQASLLEELSKRGDKEDLNTSLKKLNQAKNSNTAKFSLFQNIFNIAQQKNISLTKYPNLILYKDYLKEFSGIDLDQVLDEQTRLEEKVYGSILTNKDALLVRAIDRYIKLLNTAYHIQMSTKEFNLFEINEPDFSTIAYLAFINRKLAEFGYFQDLISYKNILEEGKAALTAFYDSVDKRDEAFIQNAKRAIEANKPQAVVLITGGYHTPHLKQLFQKEGWSYAVLTPIVTQETNQQKYEKLLLEPLQTKTKQIQTVQGEKKSKSLSSLEKDLILSKKSDEARMAELVERPEAFDRLLNQATNQTIASRLSAQVLQNGIEFRQALKAAGNHETGARLAAAASTSPEEKVFKIFEGGYSYRASKWDGVRQKQMNQIGLKIVHLLSQDLENIKNINNISNESVDRAKEIIEHLLPNAIDAIYERIDEIGDSKIREDAIKNAAISFLVSYDTASRNLIIRLSDNGVGISKDTLDDWLNPKKLNLWNSSKGIGFMGGVGVAVKFHVLGHQGEALSFLSKRLDASVGYQFTQKKDGSKELVEANRSGTGTDVTVSIPSGARLASESQGRDLGEGPVLAARLASLGVATLVMPAHPGAAVDSPPFTPVGRLGEFKKERKIPLNKMNSFEREVVKLQKRAKAAGRKLNYKAEFHSIQTRLDQILDATKLSKESLAKNLRETIDGLETRISRMEEAIDAIIKEDPEAIGKINFVGDGSYKMVLRVADYNFVYKYYSLQNGALEDESASIEFGENALHVTALTKKLSTQEFGQSLDRAVQSALDENDLSRIQELKSEYIAILREMILSGHGISDPFPYNFLVVKRDKGQFKIVYSDLDGKFLAKPNEADFFSKSLSSTTNPVALQIFRHFMIIFKGLKKSSRTYEFYKEVAGNFFGGWLTNQVMEGITQQPSAFVHTTGGQELLSKISHQWDLMRAEHQKKISVSSAASRLAATRKLLLPGKAISFGLQNLDDKKSLQHLFSVHTGVDAHGVGLYPQITFFRAKSKGEYKLRFNYEAKRSDASESEDLEATDSGLFESKRLQGVKIQYDPNQQLLSIENIDLKKRNFLIEDVSNSNCLVMQRTNQPNLGFGGKVEEVEETESLGILRQVKSRLEIEDFDQGKAIVSRDRANFYLRTNGLEPKFKYERDGDVVFYASKIFNVNENRSAVVIYLKRGEDFITRIFYVSGSLGLWRHLPNIVLEDGWVNWYGKQYGEDSLTLLPGYQSALSQLVVEQAKIDLPIKVLGDGILKKIVPQIPKRGPATTGHSIEKSTASKPVNLQALRKKSGLDEPSLAGPRADSADYPDFKKRVGFYEIAIGPSMASKAYVYLSKNKELVYTFQVYPDGAVGVYVQTTPDVDQNPLDPTLLLAKEWFKNSIPPRYEYPSQAWGYGVPIMDEEEKYQDMWLLYLRRVPVIQDFVKEILGRDLRQEVGGSGARLALTPDIQHELEFLVGVFNLSPSEARERVARPKNGIAFSSDLSFDEFDQITKTLKLDARPIWSGYMRPSYVGYDQAVCRKVNPQHEQGRSAVYLAGGAGIGRLLRTFDATQNFIVDGRKMDVNILRDELRNWEYLDSQSHVFHDARGYGYERNQGGHDELEKKFLIGLKLNGVDKKDVLTAERVDDNRVKITFLWSYQEGIKRQYEVTYINADILRPETYLNFLPKKIDNVYLNAAIDLMADKNLKIYLPSISAKMHRGSYLVTDDNIFSNFRLSAVPVDRSLEEMPEAGNFTRAGEQDSLEIKHWKSLIGIINDSQPSMSSFRDNTYGQTPTVRMKISDSVEGARFAESMGLNLNLDNSSVATAARLAEAKRGFRAKVFFAFPVAVGLGFGILALRYFARSPKVLQTQAEIKSSNVSKEKPIIIEENPTGFFKFNQTPVEKDQTISLDEAFELVVKELKEGHVAMLGDRHTESSHEALFVDFVRRAAERGLKFVIALEDDSVLDSIWNDQTLSIDEIIKRIDDRRKTINRARAWITGRILKEEEVTGSLRKEFYSQILGIARRHDLPLAGIDRRGTRTLMWDDKKQNQIEMSFGQWESGGINDYMASSIVRSANQHQLPVLVFVGANHIGRAKETNPGIDALLRQKNIGFVTIALSEQREEPAQDHPLRELLSPRHYHYLMKQVELKKRYEAPTPARLAQASAARLADNDLSLLKRSLQNSPRQPVLFGKVSQVRGLLGARLAVDFDRAAVFLPGDQSFASGFLTQKNLADLSISEKMLIENLAAFAENSSMDSGRPKPFEVQIEGVKFKTLVSFELKADKGVDVLFVNSLDSDPRGEFRYSVTKETISKIRNGSATPFHLENTARNLAGNSDFKILSLRRERDRLDRLALRLLPVILGKGEKVIVRCIVEDNFEGQNELVLADFKRDVEALRNSDRFKGSGNQIFIQYIDSGGRRSMNPQYPSDSLDANSKEIPIILLGKPTSGNIKLAQDQNASLLPIQLPDAKGNVPVMGNLADLVLAMGIACLKTDKSGRIVADPQVLENLAELQYQLVGPSQRFYVIEHSREGFQVMRLPTADGLALLEKNSIGPIAMLKVGEYLMLTAAQLSAVGSAA